MSRFFVDYETETIIITSDSLKEYDVHPELLDLLGIEIGETDFNNLDSLGFVVFNGIRKDYKGE